MVVDYAAKIGLAVTALQPGPFVSRIAASPAVSP